MKPARQEKSFWPKNISKIYIILKKTLEIVVEFVYNIVCSSVDKTRIKNLKQCYTLEYIKGGAVDVKKM